MQLIFILVFFHVWARAIFSAGIPVDKIAPTQPRNKGRLERQYKKVKYAPSRTAKDLRTKLQYLDKASIKAQNELQKAKSTQPRTLAAEAAVVKAQHDLQVAKADITDKRIVSLRENLLQAELERLEEYRKAEQEGHKEAVRNIREQTRIKTEMLLDKARFAHEQRMRTDWVYRKDYIEKKRTKAAPWWCWAVVFTACPWVWQGAAYTADFAESRYDLTEFREPDWGICPPKKDNNKDGAGLGCYRE